MFTLRNKNKSSYYSETAELEARDTTLLSKLPGKCDEEMLGRKPWQAARDGWSGYYVGSDWYI